MDSADLVLFAGGCTLSLLLAGTALLLLIRARKPDRSVVLRGTEIAEPRTLAYTYLLLGLSFGVIGASHLLPSSPAIDTIEAVAAFGSLLAAAILLFVRGRRLRSGRSSG
ncbi:hypothetical protein AB0368_07220 [Actinoplanes sp. NPDC051475]|uniref:hypothetical protein n=1 Tax=Actinoplanes sp. NPDC051475 TaxID=3157225 RepID=UPI00344B1094